MVAKTIEAQGGERHGVVTRVAHQLGVGIESLRPCVNNILAAITRLSPLGMSIARSG